MYKLNEKFSEPISDSSQQVRDSVQKLLSGVAIGNGIEGFKEGCAACREAACLSISQSIAGIEKELGPGQYRSSVERGQLPTANDHLYALAESLQTGPNRLDASLGYLAFAKPSSAAGDVKVAMARLAAPEAAKLPERLELPGSAGRDKSSPSDNLGRPIDATADNPEAVTRAYGEQLEALVKSGQLSAAEAAHMREHFNRYMNQMKGKYSPDEMARICASTNEIMAAGKPEGVSMSDAQWALMRANGVVDLACKGANPQDANGQGSHNTCAPTSLSRILQQRDFASYAEQMASVYTRGGANVGGQGGSAREFVHINPANFYPDSESRGAWNAAKFTNGADNSGGGQRSYLTQLDNALRGQEQANIAGQRDGKTYTYVAANAHLLGGRPGQAQTGEGLFEVGAGGEKTFKAGCPPATIDVVAIQNNNNGGGGVYVQENMAANFRSANGQLPPGMISFRDAADLRRQLGSAGTEFQIITNGTMVAGRRGHGLHAQTVSLNSAQQLEFGNNWTGEHNHKVYSDDRVNGFTNPANWGNYQNDGVNPDGSPKPRDWKNEYMDDDKNRRDQEKKEDQEKQGNQKLEEERHRQALQDWQAKRAQAAAKGPQALARYEAENPKPSTLTWI